MIEDYRNTGERVIWAGGGPPLTTSSNLNSFGYSREWKSGQMPALGLLELAEEYQRLGDPTPRKPSGSSLGTG
jgi:hypothetical protein